MDVEYLKHEIRRLTLIREKTEQALTLYRAVTEPQLAEFANLKRFMASVELELLRVSLITQHVDIPTLHNVIPMEVTEQYHRRRAGGER